MRLSVNHALPLAALILSIAAPAFGKDRGPVLPASGPAGDYPVVLGDPFTIGGTTWTPTDQLNYDAVGMASVGQGSGVTAAHKTLPLPAYVEVTALGTGRTILVRLERRGPMVNDALIELSPEAAAQLGIAGGAHAPVRVRRVNPPEVERAMLRSGGKAPERMETPEGLLKVLRRKLESQSPLLPPPSTPPTMPKGPAVQPAATPEIHSQKAIPGPVAVAVPPKVEKKSPATQQPQETVAHLPAKPAPSVVKYGSQVVQIGAFSVEENARKAARPLGAGVSRAGKFWRVQMGPFANSAQAAAALEKARAAGYSDARIQRAN